MILKELKFDIYDQYYDTINRYMELKPNEENEKVFVASENIKHAIEDINYVINKYNSGEFDISIYYQIMIKTDFLINIVETLYKNFIEIKLNNEGRKKIWGNDYKTIREFRLYRSLSLAHPLETTRFDDLDLGFDKDNNKWFKDIRIPHRIERITSELSKADFIIEIIEKGNEFPKKIPINIKDILSTTVIILNHLYTFTNNIKYKLNDIIENLRNTPLQAKKEMNINEYINTLYIDLKRRYPNEITKTTYEDNSAETHCILCEALERINYNNFSSSERKEKYNEYKKEIENLIYNYGNSIQNMSLEKTKANKKLHDILYPNSLILSNKSTVENAYYRYEKVFIYLSNSNHRSIESATEKLKKFSYNGCRNSKICTNSEWGVIQLITLQDEFLPYFPIDFNGTDKELFFQFCTALYYANRFLI
ncbi:hypothetical protein ACSW88_06965 [Clostridium perfringens]|uniref:hypothetical protein n=1 Tax=Clostridium perfringens TaxID=1502 RepID=UPI002224C712|nr:hypothetical protein [Clostridium perfringens]UYX11650.1 hypothetical protein OKA01_07290 [Clostridium perfringens]